jgi:hypothetical protein
VIIDASNFNMLMVQFKSPLPLCVECFMWISGLRAFGVVNRFLVRRLEGEEEAAVLFSLF